MKQRKANQDSASELNHEYYTQGCKAFDASEYQKALTLFKHSIEYWPEDPQAWMAVGNCYDALKKPKKAEEAFRCSLQYSATNSNESVLFNLGNSLFYQVRYIEAIEIFKGIEPGTELWRKAQNNIQIARKMHESNN